MTDRASRPTQERRILHLLQASWPNWVPAPELARISLQYSSRIFSLRRKGWLLQNRVRIVGGVRHGEFRLGTAPIPSSRELRQRQAPPAADAGGLFGDIAPDRTYRE